MRSIMRRARASGRWRSLSRRCSDTSLAVRGSTRSPEKPGPRATRLSELTPRAEWKRCIVARARKALARRDGAVEHLRARLVRETKCREAIYDQMDRTTPPANSPRASCPAIPTKKSCGCWRDIYKDTGGRWRFIRQGQLVSNRSPDTAGPERVTAPRVRAASSHADRQSLARVKHRLTGCAVSASAFRSARGREWRDGLP